MQAGMWLQQPMMWPWRPRCDGAVKVVATVAKIVTAETEAVSMEPRSRQQQGLRSIRGGGNGKGGTPSTMLVLCQLLD